MPASDRSSALVPVLLVQFIGSLGISLVLPFLVFVVREFGGNGLAYGILGAIYPASQMIGAPLLGRWSDRIGRRPVLTITQAGTLISWLVFLGAMSLPVVRLTDSPIGVVTIPLLGLFVARALDGLTGGNIAVAHAVVGDVSTDFDRPRNFGRLGAASNLGFIVGPMLAGLLGGTAWGAKLPVLSAAVVAAVGLILIRRRLPETKPPRTDDADDDASLGLRATLRLPGAAALLPLYFVIFLAFNIFYTAFPVHAAETLGWDPTRMGIFFAVLSGSMVVVQGPVLARLAPRLPAATLVAGGNVLLAAAFACLVTGDPRLTWACAVLFAAGNGLMWPSYLAVLSTVGGARHRGSVQGHAASMGSAAAIVGLLLGGVLYDRLGPAAFWFSSAVIFVAGLASGRACQVQASDVEVRAETAVPPRK